MLTRSGLLIGALSASALTAAAVVYEWRPGVPPPDARRFLFLSEADRAALAAIAPVMSGRANTVQVLRGFDAAVAGLPPAVRAQLRQLLDLLAFPPGRIFLAGVPKRWDDADPAAIARFLQAWRTSPFAKVRSAYDALHQLTLAACYADPATWTAIGYPGPPAVR